MGGLGQNRPNPPSSIRKGPGCGSWLSIATRPGNQKVWLLFGATYSNLRGFKGGWVEQLCHLDGALR